jgi:hypothetical protein
MQQMYKMVDIIITQVTFSSMYSIARIEICINKVYMFVRILHVPHYVSATSPTG